MEKMRRNSVQEVNVNRRKISKMSECSMFGGSKHVARPRQLHPKAKHKASTSYAKINQSHEKRISEWNDDRVNFSLFKFSSFIFYLFIYFLLIAVLPISSQIWNRKKKLEKNEERATTATVLTVANTRIHYKISFYVNKTQNVKDNQGLAWVLCVCAKRKRSESQKRNEMFHFLLLKLLFSHSVWYVPCIQTTTTGFVCFLIRFFFYFCFFLLFCSFVCL